MVHIAKDGQVLQAAPWSITRIVSGIFDMVYLLTLISPGSSSQDIRPSIAGRSSGSGGGSRGGSGPSSGSGFPNRRIGRIQHHANIPIPGGCSGGACGR